MFPTTLPAPPLFALMWGFVLPSTLALGPEDEEDGTPEVDEHEDDTDEEDDDEEDEPDSDDDADEDGESEADDDTADEG